MKPAAGRNDSAKFDDTLDLEGDWSGWLGIVKKAVKHFIPRSLMATRRRKARQTMAGAAGLTLVEHDLCFDLVKEDRTLRIRSSHAIYLEHMIESFDFFADKMTGIEMFM